jgi:hypothetical protein
MGNLKKKQNPGALVIFGNPGKGKKAKRRKRNATTEMEQAVDLFTEFHGRDPEEVITLQRSAAMRLDYTALGPLYGFGLYVEGEKIPNPNHWEAYPGAIECREAGIMLAANPDGTQLYTIGGDQDFSSLAERIEGVDANKDLMNFGELAFVVYLARKSMDDFHEIEYVHAFGMLDSRHVPDPAARRPILGYEKLKRELFIVGGSYTVAAPGIEG